MVVERVVIVPPAAPGSKGDEGMLRGAVALFGAFPIRIVNPEPGPGWLSVLPQAEGDRRSISEINMPICDYRTELRNGDLLLFVGADVVDGTCGLHPALDRIDLMTVAVEYKLPVLVSCSFRPCVDTSIVHRLRRLSDIHFLIRDPLSLENFKQQTGMSAEYFPDLSFFVGAEDSPLSKSMRERIAVAKKRSTPVIGLNFAEHSFRSFYDEHDNKHRHDFVKTILSQLQAAFPDAFYVLFSNDSRGWPNHPPDYFFSNIVADLLNEARGHDQYLKLPPQISYVENISVLGDVDFLVSGRMHLCLAAFEMQTPPFVLMGEGRGYSSADKMRGAFKANLGTTLGVVTSTETLGAIISEAIGRRPELDANMAEATLQRAKDCDNARLMLKRLIGQDFFPLPAKAKRETSRRTAMAILLKQHEEQRLADERFDCQFAGAMRFQARLAEAERALADAAKETERRLFAEVERGNRLEVERAEAERALMNAARETSQRLAKLEHANGVLTRAGAIMAEELRHTAARPWHPVKRSMQSFFLKFALQFSGLMSDRTIERHRQSLAKRKPRRFIYAWEATLAEAWGTEPPVDPLIAPLPIHSRLAIAPSLTSKLLLCLAFISAPFSKRRAERFRRSVEKRDPLMFPGVDSNDLTAAGLMAGIEIPKPLQELKRARRILVANYRIPRTDVSAGDKTTFKLISDLCAIGFEVTFVPIDMADSAPYRADLEALGVTVITRHSRFRYGGDYIRGEGAKFGAFYFITIDVAESLLECARQVAPDARVIFHAPDLCLLRETRAAELNWDPAQMEAADQMRAREIAIMRSCDHVVLVRPAELPFLEEVVPRSRISVFPTLDSPLVANPIGHHARRDICFLGGFKHLPEVDSVIWFVENVWPAVHERLPSVEFHVIGAEAPEEVIALGSRPGVRFVGVVQDLDSVISELRLSVRPLLYGTEDKGKLYALMSAGVPCVSTHIDTEGTGMVDGVHALLRDDAESFAEAVVALYSDAELWQRLSDKGRQLVEDRFGDAANQSAFYRVLDGASALPLDMYVGWLQAANPVPLPSPGPNEPVEVSIIVIAYNQWSITRGCLNSVQRAIRGTGITCEVILAVGASTDETQDAAQIFPGLRIVREEGNLGFPGNCNAAAAEARGDALLFLSDKCVVLPDWLTELIRVLREEPQAAIVGSRTLNPDGTIHDTGGVLFSDASVTNLGRGNHRLHPMFSFNREVDFVTGASMLVRRTFWDSIGGFDARFRAECFGSRDLAISAYSSGLRVVCAARSEVVLFEDVAQKEAVTTAPDAHQLNAIRELKEKWSSHFLNEHLAARTEPLVAAAHAERHPFAAARQRRETGKLNVLYFSPFPSHPDNHGNQATIQSFGRRFQKLGHKVHFALLQSNMYDTAALEGMQRAWDTLDILPNTRQLWANGKEIAFDGWYEPGLGENIRLLCARYDIDVVFCSYVFQSKMLEFVPAHVLKVIDTHDKMGDRYEMLRRNGQPLEFFSCTTEQEGAYLRRADLVVARRAEEAEYFNSVTKLDTAIVIPHFEEPRFQDRRFETLRNVGLVASANRINLAIILDFVRALERAAEDGKPPFNVHVAGQVRDMIRDLPPNDQAAFAKDWIFLHGFVPDIGDFYAKMDLMVSPVTMGTGINVKTVQAMAFGMPLVTTAWGSKGIETDDPMHRFTNLDDLAAELVALPGRPDVIDRLARLSRNRYERFLDESLAGFSTLISMACTEVAKQGKALTRVDAAFGPEAERTALQRAADTASDRRKCFCGAMLMPLEQFGRPMVRHWRYGEAPAYTCTRCGYVGFVPPSDEELAIYYKSDYGSSASDYYSYEKDHETNKTASRSKLILDVAKTYHGQAFAGRVVELGCAFGGAVSELRRGGVNAFGLDLNSSAIAEGRMKGNAFIFDMAPDEFARAFGITADLVYSFHMLEHVSDLRSYLKSVDTLLNDDGVAFFRVPNGAYLKVWLQGFDTWEWFAFPDHLHMLTPFSVAALVRECGFELVGLRSNACGETLESIIAWLPEAATRGMEAVTLLEEAGCLKELEFVFRKTKGKAAEAPTAPPASIADFAACAEIFEAEMKFRPRQFALKVLKYRD